MPRSLNLDFTPLTRRASLSSRVRAIAANNRIVIGSVVCVLMVVVPAVVFVGMLAAGSITDSGAPVVLGMFFLGGVAAVASVLHDARKAAALIAFARANNLDLTVGQAASDYTGSLFANGTHTVDYSVRTRDADFVEVGTYWTVGQTARSMFIRARLAGSVARQPQNGELVSGGLDDALKEFAGRYWIEVAGDELTLFGGKPLDANEPGRVEGAFGFAVELVRRANSTLPTTPVARPAVSDEPETSRPSALVTVGLTLACLIGFPIAVAIVMSSAEEFTRGNNPFARVAIYLIVSAAMAMMGALLRFVSKRHRRPSKRTRMILRGLGVLTGVFIVGFVALIGVGIYLSSQEDKENAQRNTDWEREQSDQLDSLTQRAVPYADKFLSLVNAGKKKAAIRVTCKPSDELLHDDSIAAAIKAKAKLKASPKTDPDGVSEFVNIAVTGTAHGKPVPKTTVGMQSKDGGKTWCASTFEYGLE